MADGTESESRKLLGRLREVMASSDAGQTRLDKITHLIADSMGTEVCSVYLFRDSETLELCATEGLQAEAVHHTRMRLGEGLVGRVARAGRVVNTANAPAEPGFRYMPETGEERYSSFLGIPIQRLGESLGVLVVQSHEAREFSADEVYALEVVAMVIAEMTELGAFVGEGAALSPLHQQSVMLPGTVAQEGAAEGHVWLHEPRVVVTNLVSDDPEREQRQRNGEPAFLEDDGNGQGKRGERGRRKGGGGDLVGGAFRRGGKLACEPPRAFRVNQPEADGQRPPGKVRREPRHPPEEKEEGGDGHGSSKSRPKPRAPPHQNLHIAEAAIKRHERGLHLPTSKQGRTESVLIHTFGPIVNWFDTIIVLGPFCHDHPDEEFRVNPLFHFTFRP